MSGVESLMPEPARCLAASGADVLCVPAALAGPPARTSPASAAALPDPIPRGT
ncbi:MAG: hypothetical protein ACRD0J_07915 [Acidimicrobiales bacterium]